MQHLVIDVAPVPEYSADKSAIAVCLLVLDGDELGEDPVGEGLFGDAPVVLAFLRRVNTLEPYPVLAPLSVQNCQGVPVSNGNNLSNQLCTLGRKGYDSDSRAEQ